MSARERFRKQSAAVLRRVARWVNQSPPGAPASPVSNDTPPDRDNTSALYAWCRAQDSAARPAYLWSVLQAARSATNLGIPRITAIEFGVAGGNGLLALEAAAAEAERHFPVAVEVAGFDSGVGMPPPLDHRDVPWVISPGVLAMDEAALRARLQRSELVIGPVTDTVPTWLGSPHPPVGFVAFDLDYYSSTIDAFRLFDAPDNTVMPRVLCYFDDVFGYGWSDFSGERAAITDFNAARPDRKIGKIHGLRFELPADEFTRAWPDQLYLAHFFAHERYNEFEGGVSQAFLDAHRLR